LRKSKLSLVAWELDPTQSAKITAERIVTIGDLDPNKVEWIVVASAPLSSVTVSHLGPIDSSITSHALTLSSSTLP
jgi:hypothetical protein